jgi:hypothetical protein
VDVSIACAMLSRFVYVSVGYKLSALLYLSGNRQQRFHLFR